MKLKILAVMAGVAAFGMGPTYAGATSKPPSDPASAKAVGYAEWLTQRASSLLRRDGARSKEADRAADLAAALRHICGPRNPTD